MALPTPELNKLSWDRRRAFLQLHGVTLSEHKVCLRRLFGKRCQYGCRDHQPQTDRVDRDGFICQPSGIDHPYMLLKGTKPWALMYQPYDISAKNLKALHDLGDRLGLEITIDKESSWHYPGWTTLVLIRRREV